VRLLQQFTGFTLDQETNISPPEKWASEFLGTRKSSEKIHPLAHLTMYIKVWFELIHSEWLFIESVLKGGLWVRMKELQPGAIDSAM
jgi:hypothetical protein